MIEPVAEIDGEFLFRIRCLGTFLTWLDSRRCALSARTPWLQNSSGIGVNLASTSYVVRATRRLPRIITTAPPELAVVPIEEFVHA